MEFMKKMLSSMKMRSGDDRNYEEDDNEDEMSSERETMQDDENFQDNDDNSFEEKEMKPFFFRKNHNDDTKQDVYSGSIISFEQQRRERSVRKLQTSQERVSEVKMIAPLTYDEAKDVVDLLGDGKIVVLNLDRVKVDLGQKIIDFTAGACYTMGGDMQAISRKIFIATPNGVALSGDFSNVLTSSGSIDFSMLNINS